MTDNNENRAGLSLAEAKTASINEKAKAWSDLMWQRGEKSW